MTYTSLLVEYWRSRPKLWGAKLIVWALMLMCVCAAPFMLYVMITNSDTVPLVLSYLLLIGALVAHVGFIVGILHLTWEMYFRRPSREQ